ncbi:hypothetical protein ABBQ32_007119 [Trebouxia sp. C0010 RCD-2024]
MRQLWQYFVQHWKLGVAMIKRRVERFDLPVVLHPAKGGGCSRRLPHRSPGCSKLLGPARRRLLYRKQNFRIHNDRQALSAAAEREPGRRPSARLGQLRMSGNKQQLRIKTLYRMANTVCVYRCRRSCALTMLAWSLSSLL